MLRSSLSVRADHSRPFNIISLSIVIILPQIDAIQHVICLCPCRLCVLYILVIVDGIPQLSGDEFWTELQFRAAEIVQFHTDLLAIFDLGIMQTFILSHFNVSRQELSSDAQYYSI